MGKSLEEWVELASGDGYSVDGKLIAKAIRGAVSQERERMQRIQLRSERQGPPRPAPVAGGQGVGDRGGIGMGKRGWLLVIAVVVGSLAVSAVLSWYGTRTVRELGLTDPVSITPPPWSD